MAKSRKRVSWHDAHQDLLDMNEEDLHNLALRCFNASRDNVEDSISMCCIINKGYEKNRVIRSYNDTYAAHTYIAIVKSCIQSNIMALSRLWDKDDDALSITNIIRILTIARFKDYVIAKKRKEYIQNINDYENIVLCNPDLTQMIAEQDEEISSKNRKEMDSIISSADRIFQSDLMASLNNIRSSLFAHSLTSTFAEKKAKDEGGEIGELFLGDETEIAHKTIEIFERISILLTGKHFERRNIISKWMKSSEDFWLGNAPNQNL